MFLWILSLFWREALKWVDLLLIQGGDQMVVLIEMSATISSENLT